MWKQLSVLSRPVSCLLQTCINESLFSMMLDHLKNNGKVKAYKTHSAHILQQGWGKKKVEFSFKEKSLYMDI